MKTQTIMLLGASGQIGQALQHQPLPPDWRLDCYSHAQLDITHHGAVQKMLAETQPALVINLAAMTAVDQCEKEQDKAVAINFEAAANLAAHCATNDIPLIHLSTDYVFDGRDGGRPYTTNHKMNPLSFYGHSKMMGEEAVRQTHSWHVILRVSSVFSEFGANLLPRLLHLIDTRDELRLVTDQIAAPTYAPDIALALVTIATGILQGKSDGFGTLHLCGEPACTRLQFTEAIAEAYRPYSNRTPKLLPALSSDFPGLAERPVYSVLDCSRIHKLYGIAQKPWRDGLRRAIASLQKQKAQGIA